MSLIGQFPIGGLPIGATASPAFSPTPILPSFVNAQDSALAMIAARDGVLATVVPLDSALALILAIEIA